MVDLLSDVWSLLDIESARATRLQAGGDWALGFPARQFLKFVAVVRGHCWITVEGERPCPLEEGDAFLLANAPGYVVASDPHLKADDGIPLFDGGRNTVALPCGDETVLLGGGFVLQGTSARLSLDTLPPFMHIAAGDPAASILRSSLQVLDDELRSEHLGRSMMTRRLADILWVQALRACVSMSGGARTVGWIGALHDARVGAALRLMHGNPRNRWTVGEIADRVGMSRSAFACRFKALVGSTPLDHLLQWRMQLACDALRRGEVSVAALAARLGYASESAFANAFKRVVGDAPKRYASMRASKGDTP